MVYLTQRDYISCNGKLADIGGVVHFPNVDKIKGKNTRIESYSFGYLVAF